MTTKNRQPQLKYETKQEVKRILDSLGKINPDDIANEDGNIDFDKLKVRSEMVDAITKLKEMGVTRKYLMDNFFLAGMTIGYLIN